MAGNIKNKYIKMFFLLYAAMVFISCVDLKVDLLIRANNSGTLDLDYKIPWVLENVHNYENSKLIPLPLGSGEIEAIAANNPDLKLIRVNLEEEPSFYRIQAKINFGNIESIKALFNYSDEDLIINSARRNSRIEAFLFKNKDKINQNTVNMIKTIFPDYKIEITVNTVSEIDNEENMVLSNNNRTAKYSADILNILSNEDPVKISFTW